MTATRIARVPYLNSVPFFRGWPAGASDELVDCVPRQLGRQAASGGLAAGLLPLVDYFQMERTFERIVPFGIAVRGRVHSVVLFARKPIRQLEGATVAVTEETSTTAVLLRLILEQRYRVVPAAYRRVPHGWVLPDQPNGAPDAGGQAAAVPSPGSPAGAPEAARQAAGVTTPSGSEAAAGGSAARPRMALPDADAVLLIGDEALRFRAVNTFYPFEVDLAFEWWLWQHLPCVFALWAVRRDQDHQDKQRIEAALVRALAVNLGQLEAIAQEHAPRFGLPASELEEYLSRFIYRLGPTEEHAIRQFRALIHEHHLL
jgi:chorismate dehydratase